MNFNFNEHGELEPPMCRECGTNIYPASIADSGDWTHIGPKTTLGGKERRLNKKHKPTPHDGRTPLQDHVSRELSYLRETGDEIEPAMNIPDHLGPQFRRKPKRYTYGPPNKPKN